MASLSYNTTLSIGPLIIIIAILMEITIEIPMVVGITMMRIVFMRMSLGDVHDGENENFKPQ